MPGRRDEINRFPALPGGPGKDTGQWCARWEIWFRRPSPRPSSLWKARTTTSPTGSSKADDIVDDLEVEIDGKCLSSIALPAAPQGPALRVRRAQDHHRPGARRGRPSTSRKEAEDELNRYPLLKPSSTSKNAGHRHRNASGRADIVRRGRPRARRGLPARRGARHS